MTTQNTPAPDRVADRKRRNAARIAGEVERELQSLRGREDRLAGYDYFLDLLAGGIHPGAVERRTGMPALNLLCIQAPLELIHAAGFLPFKIFSGSHAADALNAGGLPALTCPLLRSVQGLLQFEDSLARRPWVLPTTCDWIVKLPEMLRSTCPDAKMPDHWLELPHLKETDAGREHWRDEVFRLKKFLENASGRRIGRKDLARSIATYSRAWEALSRLEARRQAGAIPFVWFLALANTFFLDAPERWTASVDALIPTLPDNAGRKEGRIFFAGSPVYFPNFKLPRLIEEAGIAVTGDDLCSSGRIFPGGVSADAASEHELVAALAQRYHQGCLCPVFADNDRRVHNILAVAGNFSGVLFHVLKGCHPYDLESHSLENALKRQGLKFIRLETDYTAEDSRNLLTRLEAFRQTLGEA
ncbi:MAG: 2-hydroxyacyl-CoA dehydratase family protein [Acidobacteriota bacterium]|jgi:benzoyl-CoA reductase/2-hydroxyglutaryl-CoA dehydratase subunit BcrC/BadD/HgdB|nr:2-hydroxyacyl-CoA dehydratase family protein [Acidobacteriota bacterium]